VHSPEKDSESFTAFHTGIPKGIAGTETNIISDGSATRITRQIISERQSWPWWSCLVVTDVVEQDPG